jgi:predicted MFS family arabinose efflux permease
MPVTGSVTYGNQLAILKKPGVWLSLIMCFLMFSAEFSMYSYFADYMIHIKSVSTKGVSYLMFLFGITGLLGNWIAGKTLGKNISLTNISFLAGCNIIVPLCLYFAGYASLTTAAIVALWGIFFAPGFLIATASISSAAPEALEFANGLTASFANFGITAGTMVGGLIIVHKGIAQVPWVTVGFGIAAIILVFVRHFWKSGIKKATVNLPVVNDKSTIEVEIS